MYWHLAGLSFILRSGTKLLIITKKAMGPIFVPWGTPACNLSQAEISPLYLIAWRWSDKNPHSQGIKEVLTPRFINWLIIILWSTLSNASLKSMAINTAELFGLSRTQCISSRSLTKQWDVEDPFKEPNLNLSMKDCMSLRIHSTTNSLNTLEKIQVCEMGRRLSMVRWLVLGTCTTKAFLSNFRNYTISGKLFYAWRKAVWPSRFT